METRGTPMMYFKALNRPFLWCRVEKKFFFINILCSLPLAWSCMFSIWWMDLLAVVIFFIGHTIGVMVTRADPQMVELYLKHTKYARYYAGQSTIHSKQLPIRDSVPFYQGKGGFV